VLVPATQEEEVRQRFVAYLQYDLGVPLECIATEEHLTHFKSRARGRADVVVSASERKSDRKPLFVAECKAPDVPLDDDALEQVLYYHSIIDGSAKAVVTTNGLDTRWYKVHPEGPPEQLVGAASFSDLLVNILPPPLLPKPKPPRPAAQTLTPKERDWLVAEILLGEASRASQRVQSRVA